MRIKLREGGAEVELSTYEALVARVFNIALNGDLKAAKLIFERTEEVGALDERPMTDTEVADHFLKSATAEEIGQIDQILKQINRYHVPSDPP